MERTKNQATSADLPPFLSIFPLLPPFFCSFSPCRNIISAIGRGINAVISAIVRPSFLPFLLQRFDEPRTFSPSSPALLFPPSLPPSPFLYPPTQAGLIMAIVGGITGCLVAIFNFLTCGCVSFSFLHRFGSLRRSRLLNFLSFSFHQCSGGRRSRGGTVHA